MIRSGGYTGRGSGDACHWQLPIESGGGHGAPLRLDDLDRPDKIGVDCYWTAVGPAGQIGLSLTWGARGIQLVLSASMVAEPKGEPPNEGPLRKVDGAVAPEPDFPVTGRSTGDPFGRYDCVEGGDVRQFRIPAGSQLIGPPTTVGSETVAVLRIDNTDGLTAMHELAEQIGDGASVRTHDTPDGEITAIEHQGAGSCQITASVDRQHILIQTYLGGS
jgi:hypothetical protein